MKGCLQITKRYRHLVPDPSHPGAIVLGWGVVLLTSLVLSTNEYEEFRHVVEPATYRPIRVGAGVGYAMKPGFRGIRQP